MDSQKKSFGDLSIIIEERDSELESDEKTTEQSRTTSSALIKRPLSKIPRPVGQKFKTVPHVQSQYISSKVPPKGSLKASKNEKIMKPPIPFEAPSTNTKVQKGRISKRPPLRGSTKVKEKKIATSFQRSGFGGISKQTAKERVQADKYSKVQKIGQTVSTTTTASSRIKVHSKRGTRITSAVETSRIYDPDSREYTAQELDTFDREREEDIRAGLVRSPFLSKSNFWLNKIGEYKGLIVGRRTRVPPSLIAKYGTPENVPKIIPVTIPMPKETLWVKESLIRSKRAALKEALGQDPSPEAVSNQVEDPAEKLFYERMLQHRHRLAHEDPLYREALEHSKWVEEQAIAKYVTEQLARINFANGSGSKKVKTSPSITTSEKQSPPIMRSYSVEEISPTRSSTHQTSVTSPPFQDPGSPEDEADVEKSFHEPIQQHMYSTAEYIDSLCTCKQFSIYQEERAIQRGIKPGPLNYREFVASLPPCLCDMIKKRPTSQVAQSSGPTVTKVNVSTTQKSDHPSLIPAAMDRDVIRGSQLTMEPTSSYSAEIVRKSSPKRAIERENTKSHVSVSPVEEKMEGKKSASIVETVLRLSKLETSPVGQSFNDPFRQSPASDIFVRKVQSIRPSPSTHYEDDTELHTLSRKSPRLYHPLPPYAPPDQRFQATIRTSEDLPTNLQRHAPWAGPAESKRSPHREGSRRIKEKFYYADARRMYERVLRESRIVVDRQLADLEDVKEQVKISAAFLATPWAPSIKLSPLTPPRSPTTTQSPKSISIGNNRAEEPRESSKYPRSIRSPYYQSKTIGQLESAISSPSGSIEEVEMNVMDLGFIESDD